MTPAQCCLSQVRGWANALATCCFTVQQHAVIEAPAERPAPASGLLMLSSSPDCMLSYSFKVVGVTIRMDVRATLPQVRSNLT